MPANLATVLVVDDFIEKRNFYDKLNTSNESKHVEAKKK